MKNVIWAIVFGLFLSTWQASLAEQMQAKLIEIPKSALGQTKFWSKLERKCDQELLVSARPVAAFAPHPHYSADGTNAKNPQAEALAQDGKMAFRAALCFAITGEQKYSNHAQQIIDAWALQLKSVGNAQGVADINFNMPIFVFAASLVSKGGQWDQSQFKLFLKNVIRPLSRSDKPNNHGNWGVLLNASIAAYVGDQSELKLAQERWQDLLVSQVANDGSMPLEICRSDSSDHCGGPHKGINGMAYTHFALQPASLAAEIFRLNGLDVYQTPAGAKLRSAYLLVSKWTLDARSFPFYETNSGQLNGLEKCGYFALLQIRFQVLDSAVQAGLCKTDPYYLLQLFH